MKSSYYLYLLLSFFFSSCTTVSSIFTPSPYKSYAKSLQASKLDETQLGKAWINAGKHAVDSVRDTIDLPFRAEIFFRENIPSAIGYLIVYRESTELIIKITTRSADNGGVFVNLIQPNAFTKNAVDIFTRDTTFNFKDNEDAQLFLRIQPKLLENQYVTVEIFEKAKLGFPVLGGVNRDIQSFWGASRGGGSRKHEGVDIFNKRNTPVLAVEDGIISRVQETNLGGKVVWQRLGLAGQSIYYAHLDSQLVSVGQTVKRGDPVGLMGNTGNARTTSPHLHFGIYTSGGAIDPLPYIATKDTIPGRLIFDEKQLGKEIMIETSGGVLPVNLVAVSTNSVAYTDYSKQVKSEGKLGTKFNRIRFKPKPTAEFILEKPRVNAVPVSRFDNSKNYKTLGFTEGFVYIEQNDLRGWVEKK